MRKRILYSQNYLKSKSLVNYLVKKADISPDDTILDIGAGSGVISDLLSKRAKRVISYEIDKNLFNKLSDRFAQSQNVKVLNQDFLDSPLPRDEYKVFSNIPFSKTSSIVKKLLFTDNPPLDTYLVMQKEAAVKFIRGSLISVLINAFFETSVFHEFKRNDFVPMPSVNVVMLRIIKRERPLVSVDKKSAFYDFIAYTFNRTRGANRVETKEWISKFKNFDQSGGHGQIRGAFKKLLAEQSRLPKHPREQRVLRGNRRMGS